MTASALTQEEAFARIRLLRSANIGPVSYTQLLARFGTAVAAIEALPDLARRGAKRDYQPAARERIEAEVGEARRAGARSPPELIARLVSVSGPAGGRMPNQIPIAEGLFTWPSDEPRLLAGRCTDCGNHMSPVQADCPRCSGDSTETVELGRTGTLWTWTVQSYPPKAPPFAGDADPATFEPYGVGYVEIDGKVRVESRLTISDPDELTIGMEMETVIDPLYLNDDGDEVVTFAFAPTGRTHEGADA